MKRKHPTNPNLWHCCKCGEYKTIDNFSIDKKRSKTGPYPRSYCHPCAAVLQIPKSRAWRKTIKGKETCHHYAISHRKERVERYHANGYDEKEKEQRIQLANGYVRRMLCSLNIPVNNLTMELQRVKVEMLRTNKDLKNLIAIKTPVSYFHKTRKHPTDESLIRCGNCGEYKKYECFSKDKSNINGVCGFCLECRKIRRKKNESNHINVYGKQFTNEKNHEGAIQSSRDFCGAERI